MAEKKKKDFKPGDVRPISTDSTDNPKLMAKILSNGKESLFLQYYLGCEMTVNKDGKEYKKVNNRKEFLQLYINPKTKDPKEKEQNKETLLLAKKIRFERSQQLLEEEEGFRIAKKKDINFLDWMQVYYDEYKKKDKRHIRRARTVFIDFLVEGKKDVFITAKWEAEKERVEEEFKLERKRRREEKKKEKDLKTNIKEEHPKQEDIKLKSPFRFKPSQLTDKLVENFINYLQSRFDGEGPHTLYARFKKIIKAAVKEDVLKKNPTLGISIKIDNDTLKKDVLSWEEINKLMNTHYEGENLNIRRAFNFCLWTGLRFCDVKKLTYANIDFTQRKLKFEQSKTSGQSSASWVVIPLTDSLLSLIGQPTTKNKQTELIFLLPSDTMCRKALKHWTKRAGIDKHITWHCARHSFGTNIYGNTQDIKSVSSLMGHSSLKYTEKYVREADSLKKAAMNSIPEIKED